MIRTTFNTLGVASIAYNTARITGEWLTPAMDSIGVQLNNSFAQAGVGGAVVVGGLAALVTLDHYTTGGKLLRNSPSTIKAMNDNDFDSNKVFKAASPWVVSLAAMATTSAALGLDPEASNNVAMSAEDIVNQFTGMSSILAVAFLPDIYRTRKHGKEMEAKAAASLEEKPKGPTPL